MKRGPKSFFDRLIEKLAQNRRQRLIHASNLGPGLAFFPVGREFWRFVRGKECTDLYCNKSRSALEIDWGGENYWHFRILDSICDVWPEDFERPLTHEEKVWITNCLKSHFAKQGVEVRGNLQQRRDPLS